MLTEQRFKRLARILYLNPTYSANKIACLSDWEGPPPTAAQMDRVRSWIAAKEARKAKAEERAAMQAATREIAGCEVRTRKLSGNGVAVAVACLIALPLVCLAIFQNDVFVEGLKIVGWLFVGLVVFLIVVANRSQAGRNKGRLNETMICPHCQNRGVLTEQVARKKGVSGGKATAAVLTGGVSLLAVGLSRSEQEMRCHCPKCGTTWHVG